MTWKEELQRRAREWEGAKRASEPILKIEPVEEEEIDDEEDPTICGNRRTSLMSRTGYYKCSLDPGHDGEHRSSSGRTWPNR